MRRSVKRALAVGGVIAAGAAAVAAWGTLRAVRAWSNVAARGVCSGVFVSGRPPEAVIAEDYAPFAPLDIRVDRARRSVRAGVFGVERVAVFREGLGCTAVVEEAAEEVAVSPRPRSGAAARRDLPWPEGEGPAEPPAERRAADRLAAALDRVFAPDAPADARAVVVVHRGRLVAERYAPGFDAATPLPGFSMTKSVLNALVGILVRRGALAVDERAPIRDWAGDERRAITLDQLLRMSSGLEWREGVIDPGGDDMALYAAREAAAYAAAKPLAHPSGTRWMYSTGTSAIVGGIVEDAVAPAEDAVGLAQRELFDAIGMRSGVLEVDPAGRVLGGVGGYATARDWARFGLLYLGDGVWEGRRLLPDGWVAYSAEPSPRSPFGAYGAHFWTNAGGWMPRLPRDAFFAWGFGEQWIAVVPSLDAVVVRLGWNPGLGVWDEEEFLVDVLAAFSNDVPLETPDEIRVRVVGLGGAAGRVLCFLASSADEWLAFPLRFEALPASEAEPVCTFRGAAPGTYAVAAIHDANGNGWFDRILGFLPAEGAAFTVPVGWRGPPSFEEARFAFAGGTLELTAETRYLPWASDGSGG